MNVGHLLDTVQLDYHLRNGNVTSRRHPHFPLSILNYTPKVQFDNLWDSTLEYCRGLIVDDVGNVVARPYKKFFNADTETRPETLTINQPVEPPIVTEKLDGFLGILYQYDGHVAIATRGSFTSAQAFWATSFYSSRYADMTWPAGYTPLFEGLHPDFQIVCSYPEPALVLHGLVNIETGEEMQYSALLDLAGSLGIPIARRFAVEAVMSRKEVSNEEGYVLTWPIPGKDPLKVKVKFEEYKRLHRIITGVNEKAVWELWASGKAMFGGGMIQFKDTPQHFQDWLEKVSHNLVKGYNLIYGDAVATFESVKDKLGSDQPRKHYAEEFSKYPDIKDVLFLMLDNQPHSLVERVIWKRLKPKMQPCQSHT